MICFGMLYSSAQSSLINQVNLSNPAEEALAPLRFLASDELMGRGTTRPEIHVAARYIAEQFRSSGLKEVAGMGNYFQTFNLKFIKPPQTGSFTIGTKVYKIGSDLLQARGMDTRITAPVVFANFGSATDIANLDVKGKIVIVNMGENDSTPVNAAGRLREAKQRRLQEKGAAAMIERYQRPAADWEYPKRSLNAQRSQDALDSLLPVLLLHDPGGEIEGLIKTASTAEININGSQLWTLPAKNVLGWVEGTDPKLKDQFIVLSAHYDHVGVAASPKMEEGKLDSIYNGARDNAIGVTAIINAARYFGQHPAKRSVLFIAFTAEEMGLLGSKYFAANPALPMEKIVYNLNIDNGGINDTSRVSIIGLGRTSADDDMKKAAAAYGLLAGPDPAPEQNLFDRSDNVSFAAKGVPAPTYGMGVGKVDESIFRRYHQLSDEIGDLDLAYVVKYMKSYILAAKYIADNPVQPRWKKGDKYEAAWEKLYRK
jgi:hypothetical protein